MDTFKNLVRAHKENCYKQYGLTVDDLGADRTWVYTAQLLFNNLVDSSDPENPKIPDVLRELIPELIREYSEIVGKTTKGLGVALELCASSFNPKEMELVLDLLQPVPNVVRIATPNSWMDRQNPTLRERYRQAVALWEKALNSYPQLVDVPHVERKWLQARDGQDQLLHELYDLLEAKRQDRLPALLEALQARSQLSSR